MDTLHSFMTFQIIWIRKDKKTEFLSELTIPDMQTADGIPVRVFIEKLSWYLLISCIFLFGELFVTTPVVSSERATVNIEVRVKNDYSGPRAGEVELLILTPKIESRRETDIFLIEAGRNENQPVGRNIKSFPLGCWFSFNVSCKRAKFL